MPTASDNVSKNQINCAIDSDASHVGESVIIGSMVDKEEVKENFETKTNQPRIENDTSHIIESTIPEVAIDNEDANGNFGPEANLPHLTLQSMLSEINDSFHSVISIKKTKSMDDDDSIPQMAAFSNDSFPQTDLYRLTSKGFLMILVSMSVVVVTSMLLL
jgi:hypothetical protein